MTPPSWHTLALPTFALRFQYPDTTPDGHPVEMDEVRLHVRSAGSTEVYFEVSRHLHVSAHEWYAHEARGLRARFADVRVTPLQASTVAEQPAFTFSFRWAEGQRTAVLIEQNTALYRILYDPRSPYNLELLATIAFV